MLSPRVGPLRPRGTGAPRPGPAPAEVALRARDGPAGPVGETLGGVGGTAAAPAARMRSRASAGTVMVVLARWSAGEGLGSSPLAGSAGCHELVGQWGCERARTRKVQ